MKTFVLLVIGLLFCIPCFAADLETVADEAPAVTRPAAADAASPADKMANEFFARSSLTWRERRALGLTIPNIANALRDMEKDGSLQPDMDRSLVAAMVLERLAAENPKAYAGETLDIDAIIAFIEAILPLIMTIIQLFSYAPAAVTAVACIA